MAGRPVFYKPDTPVAFSYLGVKVKRQSVPSVLGTGEHATISLDTMQKRLGVKFKEPGTRGTSVNPAAAPMTRPLCAQRWGWHPAPVGQRE